MGTVIIDIETRPLPDSETAKWAPKPELLPDLTEEETERIVAKLRTKYTTDATVEKHLNNELAKHKIKQSEDAEKFQDKLAKWENERTLNPTLSMIDAAVIQPLGGENECLIEGHNGITEEQILLTLHAVMKQASCIVGHNLKRFDVPFIKNRMAILDLIQEPWPELRWKLVDTLEEWLGGRRAKESWPAEVCTARAGMDAIAEVFGLPTKPMRTMDFPTASIEEKIEYLQHDANTTAAIAIRLGCHFEVFRGDRRTYISPQDSQDEDILAALTS